MQSDDEFNEDELTELEWREFVIIYLLLMTCIVIWGGVLYVVLTNV